MNDVNSNVFYPALAEVSSTTAKINVLASEYTMSCCYYDQSCAFDGGEWTRQIL